MKKPDLQQILADRLEMAAVLRAAGHAHDADLIEKFAREVADATEDYRRFIPESEARLRSGRSVDWFRRQFGAWHADGHAELRGRGRYYRAIIVPRRPDLIAAREAGLRGETGRKSA